MNKFKRLYSLAIVVCRLALRETHQIKPNYFILLEINIIKYQKYSSLNDLKRVHNFVTEKKINKKLVSSSDQFFFFFLIKNVVVTVHFVIYVHISNVRRINISKLQIRRFFILNPQIYIHISAFFLIDIMKYAFHFDCFSLFHLFSF